MRLFIFLLIVTCLSSACTKSCEITENNTLATTDDASWFYLKKSDLNKGTYHTSHDSIFGKYISGYNKYFLIGIDIAQRSALDGGGYFASLKADPPEAPIGYKLKFLSKNLIEPARATSYCSGSSFTAFIEGMNMIYAGKEIDDIHLEAIRMQEPDGGRREDGIKFWGQWNADGYGNHFALVQYTGIGDTIPAKRARPGDFMNISWKKGGGHSVVFLGWYRDENKKTHVVYWSSQKGTNGMGDDVVPVQKIAAIKTVRVMRPQKIFDFNPAQEVFTKIKGDKIDIN